MLIWLYFHFYFHPRLFFITSSMFFSTMFRRSLLIVRFSNFFPLLHSTLFCFWMDPLSLYTFLLLSLLFYLISSFLFSFLFSSSLLVTSLLFFCLLFFSLVFSSYLFSTLCLPCLPRLTAGRICTKHAVNDAEQYRGLHPSSYDWQCAGTRCDIMCFYVRWYDIMIDVMWCDVISCDVMWYDMMWYDMMWYDMIWYDVRWYDVRWYDMISYDVIWYDMM